MQFSNRKPLAQDMQVEKISFQAEPRLTSGVVATSSYAPGRHELGIATTDGQTVDIPYKELTYLDRYEFEYVSGRITRVMEDEYKAGKKGRSSSHRVSNPSRLKKERKFPSYLGKDKQSVDYAQDMALRIGIQGEGGRMKVFLIKSAQTVDEALNANMPVFVGDRLQAFSLQAPGSVETQNPIRITTDAGRAAHMVYVDKVGQGNEPLIALQYATNRDGQWKVTTIENLKKPDELHFTIPKAIAVDGDGHIHIGYVDGGSPRALKYATDRDGKWTVTEVTRPAGGAGIGLAVDGQKAVHISFAYVGEKGMHDAYKEAYTRRMAAGEPEEGIKYATNAGGKWEVRTIDRNEFWGQMSHHEYGHYSAVAVDSRGGVHIAYSGELRQGLRMLTMGKFLRRAVKENGAWKTSDIFYQKASHLGDYLSLACDGNDALHLAYSAGSGVGYANNADGKWRFQLPFSGKVALGGYVSLALDHAGRAHVVVYAPGKEKTFRYVNNVDGEWTLYSFGEIPPAGETSYATVRMTGHPAIAVDSAGKRHVAFHRRGSNGMGILTYLAEK